jgi:hypothetical protein
MKSSFTKSSVLDELAAQLAARRRHACERRLAYQRLATALVSQPSGAAWSSASRRPQPRPEAAAA